MKRIAIFHDRLLVPTLLAGFGLSSLALNVQTFRDRNTLADIHLVRKAAAI